MKKDEIKKAIKELEKHHILSFSEDRLILDFMKDLVNDNKELRERIKNLQDSVSFLLEENAKLKENHTGSEMYYKYKIKSLEDLINNGN